MINKDQLRDWINEINEVPMEDIVDELGITRVKDKLICPNPEHNDNHLGSCTITRHNKCKCYACGFFGDNISLMQAYAAKAGNGQLSFLGAANQIAKIAGIPSMSQEQVSTAISKPYTTKQLALLGLQSGFSFFVTSASPIKRPEEHPIGFDGENYLYGDKVNDSLDDLYQQDESTFNYIVIGKLYEKLFYLIGNYYKKMYVGLGQQCKQEMEQKIDTLLPLAEYYMPVSKSYGYDLSFIRYYEKVPSKPIQRYAAEF